MTIVLEIGSQKMEFVYHLDGEKLTVVVILGEEDGGGVGGGSVVDEGVLGFADPCMWRRRRWWSRLLQWLWIWEVTKFLARFHDSLL